MDTYEQKFKTLCHYSVNLDMSNEKRRYRMYEKDLRDEIIFMVANSLHTRYHKCMESSGTIEATVANKTYMQTKGKLKP